MKMIDLMDLERLARENMRRLKENKYPGRGIIVGLDETGENMIQMYWIMGRSENSRNRVFGVGENGRVFTEAADPAKVKDPSLIIYNAMLEVRDTSETVYLVSNGHQTDSIESTIFGGMSPVERIRCWKYEPDAPNFTPRITTVSSWKKGTWMSVLRKSPWSDACDHNLFELHELGKGFGHCITTYLGDGDPLPAFQGEPLLLPLMGTAEAIAEQYWETLNAGNKVALVVKFIPKSGPSHLVIKNRLLKATTST